MQIGRGKSKRHQKLTILNTTITERYRRIQEISVVPGGQVVGGSNPLVPTNNINGLVCFHTNPFFVKTLAR